MSSLIRASCESCIKESSALHWQAQPPRPRASSVRSTKASRRRPLHHAVEADKRAVLKVIDAALACSKQSDLHLVQRHGQLSIRGMECRPEPQCMEWIHQTPAHLLSSTPLAMALVPLIKLSRILFIHLSTTYRRSLAPVLDGEAVGATRVSSKDTRGSARPGKEELLFRHLQTKYLLDSFEPSLFLISHYWVLVGPTASVGLPPEDIAFQAWYVSWCSHFYPDMENLKSAI
ncbi:hypothetical protein PCANC_12872 [Puccinia coronata f. sp. avenae]|uniref:Uncharacterized protein n=1 Tax=Puccinia coronata f. sp. avenae TaxID=200324 RepID=A0A2N5UB85_9BASI|nr:hypothetical protein PCASD_15329 [Puccinia coronata f. sp. avenae]PLW48303.1 hypothetical protein PCANC_12872 [Puccinia coronata f. sp. avenae]